MSDRAWMIALTSEQRQALVWKCMWCGDEFRSTLSRSCSAPDGDGHQFDPVKPSTLAQQVSSAQAEVATWPEGKLARVKLAGGDQP